MAKNKNEYSHLKKISTIAKNYKDGVSVSYFYKLKDEGRIEIIDIDGVLFIDITTLPEDIKKNLKKM